jgi:monooxygenase
MKALIAKGAPTPGPGYDIDTHFKPHYNPWDQRMCLVPDGDLFEAIRRARVGRDRPHRHVHRDGASASRSGAELEADLIVTATGLNLLAVGGMQIAVDGREVELPRRWATRA